MATAKRSTATAKRSVGKKSAAKAVEAEAAPEHGEPDRVNAEAVQAQATAAPAVATKRVLLVDDDAEIVESMRTVLESRGYEILVARDGNQGLAMAESEDPDLGVLVMMLP